MALRSAPEQKLPPAPVTISTRMSGFESTSTQASYIRTSISLLRALRLAGRLSVSVATWPSCSKMAWGSSGRRRRGRLSDMVSPQQGIAAPVDEQDRAVDHGGVGGQQEGDGRGDLEGIGGRPMGTGSMSTSGPSTGSSSVPWNSGCLHRAGGHQVEPDAA